MRVPVLVATVAAIGVTAANCHNQSLVVDEAPDHVRPYVLPRFRGRATRLAETQVIRYSVTNSSSGGAFALLQHNGYVQGYTTARPHTHRKVHEHFYCSRGRVQLWGMKNATGASHEARVATLGDYGSAPPNAIHTFQLTDPDAQLTHVFHPAGFEHLFDVFSSGDFDTRGASPPYVTRDFDKNPFGALTPEEDAKLQALDLYAYYEEEAWVPRRDLINGTAGDDAALNWHDGPNELPDDPTLPYFVAKDYGPKYLHEASGYKVIQPLSTPELATGGSMSIGTIILAPKAEADVARLPNHLALQMEDGQLVVSVTGYPPATLITGDVVFIPEDVEFSYRATVPFTKFLYVNAGAKGLDYQLLQQSRKWDWPSYPQD